jgi:hypothetical protein
MSKPATRTRRNGAIVIKAVESLPRPVEPTGAANGRHTVVTLADRQLAEAVLRRRRAA